MTRKQFFAVLMGAGLAAAVTVAAARGQKAGLGAGTTIAAATAQSAAAPASAVQAYDAANEIAVKGTVEKVVDAQAPDNISGAHLIVTTAQGTMDAHLGPSASWRAQNVALAAGDAVELTGVMTNFNGKGVMLARILKTANRIAVLRNEHGIPTHTSGPRTVNAPPLAAKGGRL